MEWEGTSLRRAAGKPTWVCRAAWLGHRHRASLKVRATRKDQMGGCRSASVHGSLLTLKLLAVRIGHPTVQSRGGGGARRAAEGGAGGTPAPDWPTSNGLSLPLNIPPETRGAPLPPEQPINQASNGAVDSCDLSFARESRRCGRRWAMSGFRPASRSVRGLGLRRNRRP